MPDVYRLVKPDEVRLWSLWRVFRFLSALSTLKLSLSALLLLLQLPLLCWALGDVATVDVIIDDFV